MSRVVLITSTHQRHRWVASQLCGAGLLAGLVVEEKPIGGEQPLNSNEPAVTAYVRERSAREGYWFDGAPDTIDRLDIPVCRVSWGGSNSPEVFEFVSDLAPDRLALFGSCIIREPLLSLFPGRILNMHLGLSPYYRGSATNFWPLVHGLPECVGVTIHHATPAVDGGHILAQARPDAETRDRSHDLGCKSILEGVRLLKTMLATTVLPEGIPQSGNGILCRRRDFKPSDLERLEENFRNGMIPRYLDNKSIRDNQYPIVER